MISYAKKAISRRVLPFVTALMLLLVFLPCLCAAEETALMFTQEDFNTLADSLLQSLPADAVPSDEDGVPVYDAGIAGLILAEGEGLSPDAIVSEIRVKECDDLPLLPLGSTVADVLSAYANDNPELRGSEYAALLYMQVSPEGAGFRCGYIGREGQRTGSITYAEFSAIGSDMVCKQVTYYMEDDQVSGIRLYRTVMTEAEMMALLEELSDSLDSGDFIPAPFCNDGADAGVFRREDLTFSGFDLMDLTPELCEMLFGAPAAEMWAEDEEYDLHICEWEDLRIAFRYSKQKDFESIVSLTFMSDVLSGPRGVRWGDSLYSVMHRFRFEEGTAALYGTAPDLPYGEFTRVDDTAILRYAAEAEGKTVILYITFINDRVNDILLSVQ